MKKPDIKLRFTLKACCLFEELRNKSFYQMDDEEDVLYLLYALFVTSIEKYDITFDVFKVLLEDESVAKELLEQYSDIMLFFGQFKKDEEEKPEEDKEEVEKPKISTIVYYLISQGVDVEYVMNHMTFFEIAPIVKSIEEKEKMRLEEERLFTYLRILYTPLIDSKKLKGPQDILPFSWEAEEHKKQQEEDYKKKEAAIRAVLGLDKEERNDG